MGAIGDFYVEKASEINKSLRDWLASRHYTGTFPPKSQVVFLLRTANTLLGMAVFGKFSRKQSEESYSGWLNLSRFFVVDDTPKNTESFFLGRCLRMLERERKWVGVKSYASPSEGHSGVIYLATNFKRVGKTEKSFHYEDKDGNFIHKYSPWKKARVMGCSVDEYAKQMGYVRIQEDPKIIFEYEFRVKPKYAHQFTGQRRPVEVTEGFDKPSEFTDQHAALLLEGKYIFCDRDDLEKIGSHNWYFSAGGYLCRRDGGHVIPFHREVMTAPPGMVVDHIERNRLDNRRCKLRVITIAQNNHNRTRKKGGPIGVRYRKGKFEVSITFNHKNEYLGRYASEEEAKKVYDLAAVKRYGSAAITNHPISSYDLPGRCEAEQLPVTPVVQNRFDRYCKNCGRQASGVSDFCKNCSLVEKRRAGNVGYKKYIERVAFGATSCLTEGCARDIFSRNLCSRHYAEAREKEGYIKPKKAAKHCVIFGCQSMAAKRGGLCTIHWKEKSGIPPGRITGRPKGSYGNCHCGLPAVGTHRKCKKHYASEWRRKQVD
jgi:hypothetical protein